MASGFLTLISFFTRIPVGRKIMYSEENFKKSLSLYTLMGAVIGLMLALIFLMFANFRITFVRGVVLTIGYVAVTGGIHLDGAADTADGLFSGRTGDRVFEIMSDSHIGAFGVICLVMILLSQFVFFSYADIYACLMMPVAGRASLTASCYKKKYAKNTKGMGTLFVESMTSNVVAANMAILAALVIVLPNSAALAAACFASLVSAVFISGWVEGRIGGMTGDTCGFVTEITQIIFMILVLFLKG